MLTTAQQATLAAYVTANQALSSLPHSSDGAFEIARLLNLEATPQWVVWRSAVPVEEIMRNGMDWSRVDNLSVGKARIWEWLSRLGTIDASKVNIRAGIDATWIGTAADLAVRATVYTHCKRFATVAEKLFSTGIGTDASPATMTFEGALSYQDVEQARG